MVVHTHTHSTESTSWLVVSGHDLRPPPLCRHLRGACFRHGICHLNQRIFLWGRVGASPRSKYRSCCLYAECVQVRGESKDFADKGRSSHGIPWRQLPLYDCHGFSDEVDVDLESKAYCAGYSHIAAKS